MKNIFLVTICLIVSWLINPSAILAANNTNNSNQSQSQNQNQTQTQSSNPETGNLEKNQLQTQTETQSQIQTQTNEQYMQKNADCVQNLLNLSYQLSDNNLGQQIKNIAEEQNQGEEKAIQAMEQIQTRSKFMQFLIGPNYSQLKIVNQEIEQNQLRIQELQQIAAKISNNSELTQLQNQIQTLEEQNTSLQNQANQFSNTFSIFGWLIKLFSNNQ